MAYLVVCVTALAVSALTLFSGFGLGTLLMPAFALFFPVTVAVAATAVVHLANNLFKAFLLGKHADWAIVLRFGIPGAFAAFAGAWILESLADAPAIVEYTFGGRACAVTPVKLVMGLLIVGFSFFEMLPQLQRFRFKREHVVAGGLLSGFFGGLSGHQGALRSAFLINLGLKKEAFIATGVMASVIVDVARLLIYGFAFYQDRFASLSGEIAWLVAAASAVAFIGAFLGARLMSKVTLRAVQVFVGVMLFLIGIGMAAGLA